VLCQRRRKKKKKKSSPFRKMIAMGKGMEIVLIMMKMITTATKPLMKTMLGKGRRNLRMTRIITRMTANMLERLPRQKRKQPYQQQTLFHLTMIRMLMIFKKRKLVRRRTVAADPELNVLQDVLVYEQDRDIYHISRKALKQHQNICFVRHRWSGDKMDHYVIQRDERSYSYEE
jgi:hypothetical protein